MGEGRDVYRVLCRYLREINHKGDPGLDGSIILRWIFKEEEMGVYAGFSWLMIDSWWALVNAVMNIWVP
jgi:hypothetical protein